MPRVLIFMLVALIGLPASAQIPIQQSTSSRNIVFLMIDSTDHVTGKTGLTVTVTLSKNAAAFGAASGAVTEISSGWYKLAGNATDSGTVGPLALHATATGADPCDQLYEVCAWNPDDSVRLGLTALANASAGASGGLLISGSNSGTTTLGALTVTGATTLTGNVAAQAGVNITQSSSNTSALVVTGNGTGHGAIFTSGSGATGDGFKVVSVATNGYGFDIVGVGANAGLISTGGATGPGAKLVGGGTSGDGLDITTTSGDGISSTPTTGNGLVLTANGTSKHGLVATGGTAGTSDGIKGVAGTGGVPIRGDLTGNITGNLSGSAGSVTGAVGSVTGNVGGNVVGSVASVTGAVGSVAGAVGSVTGAVGSVSGAVGSVTAGVTVTTNNDKTAYSLTQAFPANFSSFSIDGSGRVDIGKVLGSASAGAAGYFAPDWAHVASPSTVVNLSATNIASVGSVTGAVGSVTGNVTVGGYAAGQDPATLLAAWAVDGSITLKQLKAIEAALALESTRTWTAATHTAVLTWYRRNAGLGTADLTKPILAKTTVYDSTNTQVVSQAIALSNLP